MACTESDPTPKGLSEFYRVRDRLAIAPEVSWLMTRGYSRTKAEDIVTAVIQIFVSHSLSVVPELPYVLAAGPVNQLYVRIQNEPDSFFPEMEKQLSLKRGQFTLDGVKSSKIAVSQGPQYTLEQLISHFGAELAECLQNWNDLRYAGEIMPTALIWAQAGDRALSVAMSGNDLKWLERLWGSHCQRPSFA